MLQYTQPEAWGTKAKATHVDKVDVVCGGMNDGVDQQLICHLSMKLSIPISASSIN